MRFKLRLGTRKTPLAQAQAHQIKQQLETNGVAVSVKTFSTQGDKSPNPLRFEGGKGLFVKELEVALLEGDIDVAVHSYKDMPHLETPGLCFAGTPLREDPFDVLVVRAVLAHAVRNKQMPLKDFLSENGIKCIATCSLRRKWQLLNLFPKMHVVDMRGGVQKRLEKLCAISAASSPSSKPVIDGLILARAGLERLRVYTDDGQASHRRRLLDELIMWSFSPHHMVPSAGQGALALQCREDDHASYKTLKALSHPLTEVCLCVERAFLKAINGTCMTPVGGYAKILGAHLTFYGFLCTPDGKKAAWIQETCDFSKEKYNGHNIDVRFISALGERFAQKLQDTHKKSTQHISDCVDAP